MDEQEKENTGNGKREENKDTENSRPEEKPIETPKPEENPIEPLQPGEIPKPEENPIEAPQPVEIPKPEENPVGVPEKNDSVKDSGTNESEEKPISRQGEEENDTEKNINREIRRRTIKALAFWGVAAIAAPVVIFKWLRSRPEDNGVQGPFRKILDWNGKLFKNFVSDKHLVKTYPKEMALADPRVNGDEGVKDEVETEGYKITVTNFNHAPFDVTVDDIKALPKHDITYSFKCIEGWDMITNWSGALFSDFVAKYKLGTHNGNVLDKSNPHDIADYVGMETPDGGYYIGLDIESALHPQTILCYEMNGDDLPDEHGGPLRLIIPTKYGIKNIKRIGKISFSDERPHDFWFEQGYDYFAGL